MLPLVSCPESECLKVCPPHLCGWWYLARVWVEGRRRRCPPDDLEVLNAFSPYRQKATTTQDRSGQENVAHNPK